MRWILLCRCWWQPKPHALLVGGRCPAFHGVGEANKGERGADSQMGDEDVAEALSGTRRFEGGVVAPFPTRARKCVFRVTQGSECLEHLKRTCAPAFSQRWMPRGEFAPQSASTGTGAKSETARRAILAGGVISVLVLN